MLSRIDETNRSIAAVVAVPVAMVLGTILDFDRPRGGFFRVGEEGLVRLQTAFEHPRP